MGTWGTGLYQDDTAKDLKNTIALLAKVPVSGDRILEILLENHKDGVELTDDGGPTFWLVVADQFERRGIACRSAFERALDAITSGADLRDQEGRGMEKGDLGKRSRVLTEIAGRLRSPRPQRPRPTGKKPPSFDVDVGEVYAFPTMERESFNAWGPNWEAMSFVPDGWGAMLVVARGRVFDWLPWCAISSLSVPSSRMPTLDAAVQARFLYESGAALCVPRKAHLKKMGMQLLGQLTLDPRKAASVITKKTSPEFAVTAGWSFVADSRAWKEGVNGNGVLVSTLLA